MRGAMDAMPSSSDDAATPASDARDQHILDETVFDTDGDTLREECGVFGIFGHPDAAAITATVRRPIATPTAPAIQARRSIAPSAAPSAST